jgi:sulfite exporter TauE/SafE/copper chaperone CopZ
MSYKVTLETSGMHCKACELYLESIIEKQKGVKSADAILSSGKVEIELEEGTDLNLIKKRVEKEIKTKGYSFGSEIKPAFTAKKIAISIIISLFLLVFIRWIETTLVQVNVNKDYGDLVRVFFVGVIASISSCAAVTSALVVSFSASQHKSSSLKNIIVFHISRLIAFALFGGLLGLFGSVFFSYNQNLYWFTTITKIIASILLLFIGLGLLMPDKFSSFTKFSISKSFSKNILNKYKTSQIMPILLGVVSFVIPCGFTLNMQIESIISGSFFSGMLIMSVFAFGTLPVLLFLSFLSFDLSSGTKGEYLKLVAGLLTLLISIYQIYTIIVYSI